MKQLKMLSVLGVGVYVFGAVGCSSLGIEGKKIDYKSAKQVSSLELPPDLTRLNAENRYVLPKKVEGVNMSEYEKDAQNPTNALNSGVLVAANEVTLERAGNQRWLVVNKSPDVVWDVVKEFWMEHGFIIKLDQPEVGVMETDWAENRANIPSDFIRNTIGSIFDSIYSTGERDKFRTRLEKTADGKTEIYITHRGVQEVYTSTKQESTVWQPRQSDPELEAEFLRRLVVRFSASEQRAKALLPSNKVSATAPIEEKAVLQKDGAVAQSLVVNESFERSWRRVGLALEQVGFTVEDRDRTNGVFFVRYVRPEDENTTPANKKGLFSKWFGSSDAKVKVDQYQIRVSREGDKASVRIFSKDGQPEVSKTSERILTLLQAQLR